MIMRKTRKKPARAALAAGLFDELIVDNFAGGGGASMGIERGFGRAVDLAINHDSEAVELHRANHPHTIHLCEDVFHVDPVAATGGRPVGLAWFSPDCTHFSRAKGAQPVRKRIRGLAWVVVKWASKVRPRVIMLENVREFQDWGPVVPMLGTDGAALTWPDGAPKMKPCPSRKGVTFKRWVGRLRGLGYDVDWRVLDAADFGAPTHRRRLFVIARLDGVPIAWPEPTHGPGRAIPYRTAAECIDWTLPCPSIFLTRAAGQLVGVKRPLAEKTMKRIAQGLRRFVFESTSPYFVSVNHSGETFRGQDPASPLATITGANRTGIVTPYMTAQFGEAAGQIPRTHDVGEPLPTITPRHGGGFPLVAPFLAKYYGTGNGDKGESQDVRRPSATATGSPKQALVAAHVTRFFGGDRPPIGKEAGSPLPTITAVDHHGIVAANLVQYNGLKGNEARGGPLEAPMNTITSEPRFALSAANVVRIGQYGSNGSNVGDPTRPLTTITSKAEHCVSAASLIKMNHGAKQSFAVDEPLRTVLAGANHHGLTLAFLSKYYGRSTGQDRQNPLGTIMSRMRFGLVMIDSDVYELSDIGLRMLTPRELYRCQGFPEEYRIAIEVPGPRGPRALPKSAQVRMCGNSVSPPVAEALVRANFPDECPKEQPRRPARRPAGSLTR